MQTGLSIQDEALAEMEETSESASFTIEAQIDGTATGKWRGMPFRFGDIGEVAPAR